MLCAQEYDTIIVEKKADIEKEGKKVSRRDKFDRGIEKVTFVPRGQWFTGVKFSYFEH